MIRGTQYRPGLALVLAILLVSPVGATTSAAPSAAEIVETFHDCARLTARGEVCQDARAPRPLRAFLDMPVIAERVLGQPWQSADATERRSLSDLVATIVEQRMVERFGDRSVRIEDTRSLSNGDIIVHGEFVAQDDQMRRLTWQLRATTGGMLIEDMAIDGASLVVLARDQVSSLAALTDGTPAALFAVLRDRYLRN